MRKLWLVIAIVAALATAGGVFGYLLYSASSLYVSDLSITELREVSGKGISFAGEIGVTNPSGVDIDLQELRYRIVLEKTGERIATGVIDGTLVPARDAVRLPLRQETSWLPAMDTLFDLASERKVYLAIAGEADVMVASIPLSGPFTQRIDIKPLVDQWIAEKQEQLMQDPERFLKQYGIQTPKKA